MFNTPQEIEKYRLVSGLKQLAERYNMTGKYVKVSNGDDAHSTMYFVCCYDMETVEKSIQSVEKIYKNQENKDGIFIPYVHITKLTNVAPIISYLDVANFCLHSSTLRGILNKYYFDKKLEEVSVSFVQFVEAQYLDTKRGSTPFNERQKAEKILIDFLKTKGEEEFINKGRIHEDSELLFKPDKLRKDMPNMIPFTQLALETDRISRMIVASKEHEKDLMEYLKSKPELKFYKTEPFSMQLNADDNAMFGKEKNQFYTTMLFYPTHNEKEMDFAFIKTRYKHVPTQAPASVIRNDEQICSFGLPANAISDFLELADPAKYGVTAYQKPELWIEPDELYYHCDPKINPDQIISGIKINGRYADRAAINDMISTYAQIKAGRHILLEEDKKYNVNLNRKLITLDEYLERHPKEESKEEKGLLGKLFNR